MQGTQYPRRIFAMEKSFFWLRQFDDGKIRAAHVSELAHGLALIDGACDHDGSPPIGGCGTGRDRFYAFDKIPENWFGPPARAVNRVTILSRTRI